MHPTIAATLTFLAAASAVADARAGCSSDTECKGDRICEEGACTDPSSAPASPPGDAEASEPEADEANNGLYVSLGGPGILYSVNYERRFSDVSARLGVSYYSVSAAADSVESSASLLLVPLTVQYLGIGGRNHMLELGGGAVIGYASAESSGFGSAGGGEGAGVFGTLQAGYRYQPRDGGFLFRAGLSPVLGSGFFLPWLYLSFGAAF